MIKTFESIYFFKDKSDKKLMKFIKKIRKKYKNANEISNKILFFPYRYIEYSAGMRRKRLLVNTAILPYILDPFNIIFSVRNDYLNMKTLSLELDQDINLVEDSRISNEEIVNMFTDSLSKLYKRLEELEGHQFEYARKLARMDLSRVFMFPIGKRELTSTEDIVKERSRLLFLKGILEDGLGLNETIYDISQDYNVYYVPSLIMKFDEDIVIAEFTENVSLDKNMMILYNSEEELRKWIKKILI